MYITVLLVQRNTLLLCVLQAKLSLDKFSWNQCSFDVNLIFLIVLLLEPSFCYRSCYFSSELDSLMKKYIESI